MITEDAPVRYKTRRSWCGHPAGTECWTWDNLKSPGSAFLRFDDGAVIEIPTAYFPRIGIDISEDAVMKEKLPRKNTGLSRLGVLL